MASPLDVRIIADWKYRQAIETRGARAVNKCGRPRRAYTFGSMADPGRHVAAFIAHVDVLADRLRVRRRPQDAGVHECSPRELRALNELGRRGSMTMSDIAEVLDVPLSTATRTVERLVAKGLVDRKQSARDRRVVEVRFSRRGKRINQFVIDSRNAAAHALLDPLAAGDRDWLVTQLARLAGTAAADGADR
jgi:DNA-binding MarR family transcriptional regulator